MKSNLLKSLLIGAAAVAGVNTASAQAGDGTATATAYTVCPSSTQFKLTTQQNYPNDYTFSWTPISSPSGTASVVAGSGSTHNGIYTVTASSGFSTGNYSYELEVTSASGCKTKDTFFVRVIDTAVTLALGSGTDAEYCEDVIGTGGEAITLKASITGTTEEAIASNAYAWTASGTATVDAATTSTDTNGGTVPAEDGTYTFGVTVTFKVDVAPSGGCKSGEATKSIIVNPRPAAPTAGISGS